MFDSYLLYYIYFPHQVRMQVAFMLGRQQVFLELPEDMDDYEDLTEILSNSHLNTHFLSLGREVSDYLQELALRSLSVVM